ALYGRPEMLWRDEQVRLFLAIIASAIVLLVAWRVARSDDLAFWEALRQAAFVTVSTITTTGYTSHDYALWGGFAENIALLLMLIGGCTGSTVGGIKVFSIFAMFKLVRAQLYRQIYPHGTFRVTYNCENISDAVRAGVATYIFTYLM